jgi:pilus assembly protein Flp/PilA
MFRKFRDERGQGLVEYALIVALVSLAAVAALGFLSGKINDLFRKSGNVLNAVSIASPAGTPSGSPPIPGSIDLNCGGGTCSVGETPVASVIGWTTPPGAPLLGDYAEWFAKDNPSCSEPGANWGVAVDRDNNDTGFHTHAGLIWHEFTPGEPPWPSVPPGYASGDGFAVLFVIHMLNANGETTLSECETVLPAP